MLSLRRIARVLALAPLVTFVPLAHAEGPSVPPPAVRSAIIPKPTLPAIRPATTPNQEPAKPQTANHVTLPHTPLNVPVPPSAARAELLTVKDEVMQRAKAGEHPFVIFDIDDTLLTWPPPGQTEHKAIPGALAYVSSLKQAGAKIVYITGRHEPDRKDTIEQLRGAGFPIDRGEKLILNDSKLDTVDYKAVATREVVHSLGTPVAAFDNEMENARMFRRELPDPNIAVIRLRTTSIKPDPGGTGPITVINDFTPALPTVLHVPASS